jgi:hypothetical protein
MLQHTRIVAIVASLAFDALPATAAAPPAKLPDLAGSWKCTYHAGVASFPYDATYAPERDGHTLRLLASWAGGGDEELIAYDPQRNGWNAVVFEDNGAATILRGTGKDPNHVSYRSVYPDANIAETVDRISATEYTIHATVRAAGKTTASVDTCLRTP